MMPYINSGKPRKNNCKVENEGIVEHFYLCGVLISKTLLLYPLGIYGKF
jgi:hypothetical protein